MKQQGFVLFTVLVFLVILSLLGVSMFNGFIQDQKVAGNLREKTRALDAAQTAIDYVENWMTTPANVYRGDWINGVPCNSSNQTGATLVICSNALDAPTTLPWPSANAFTPNQMTLSSSGGSNTYASNPSVYVQYLGTTGGASGVALYQVTASAQGGNATAASVVRSVFQIQATSLDISGS